MPFLLADALYLAILFGWTLFLGPMGEDFRRLPEAAAGQGHWLFSVAGYLFRGSSVVGPRLVGLILLYGVVALIFRLSRPITGGPWWLGSVAAVLFMAHPLKSGAVYTVTGVAAIADGLLLLGAVWAMEVSGRGGGFRTGAGWLVPPLAAWITGRWWETLILTSGWAWVRAKDRPDGMVKVLPPTLAILGGGLYACSWDPMALFGLLHGGRAWLPVAWPFGLLPETARLFDAYPGWHAAWSLAVWMGLTLLAWRFVGRTAVRLVILSLPVCLAVGVPLDTLTFEGGAAYMTPVALLVLAAAAGFKAQLQHPRFRRRTVAVSTGVCLAFMAWHAWVAMDWIRAHRLLVEGRTAAAAMPAETPVAVFPDVYRIGFAPVRLAEALRCPPPHGGDREAYALAWVELDAFRTRRVEVPEYGPAGGVLRLIDAPGTRPWTGYRLEPRPDAPSVRDIVCRLLLPGRRNSNGEMSIWRVTPWKTLFPPRRVPFPDAGVSGGV